MSEKVCSYCWRSLCGCGAEDYGDGPGEVETLEERGIPFFYNGYVVWPLREVARDGWKFVFYLGRDVVEVIEVLREQMWEAGVDEMTDPMCFIWELFCTAQGEEEVLEICAKNDKPPVRFRIDREWYRE